MKKLIYLLVIVILVSNTLYAQNPLNIVDSPDKVIQVNGIPITGIRENSIASYNLLKPPPMVTAHNVFINSSQTNVLMYISNSDDYSNWTQIDMFSRMQSCDPCIIVDKHDNYYCVFLDGCDQSTKTIKINVNGNMTYNICSGGLDKPHAWVDKFDNMYVTYLNSNGGRVQVRKSTDLGQTWSEPIYSDPPISDDVEIIAGYNHGPNLKSGDNGELYLSWAAQGNGGAVMFNALINESWYSAPITISPSSTSNGTYGFPCIEVNSNNTNQIFCVYTNTFGLNTSGIYFKKSDNNGQTWSETPIQINPDNTYKIKPWLTYNKAFNTLFCIFYSKINGSSNYKTCISYSTNFGTNWSEDIQISDATFPLNTISGNDYIGITNKFGYIYPIWSDDRGDGQYRAYLSPLYIPHLIDSPIKNENENILSIYPNPFNPTTEIKYKIINNTNVKISIFDLSGREIITLVNENKIPGEYNITFDGSKLSSGIYFCKTLIGNNIYTNKIVIVK